MQYMYMYMYVQEITRCEKTPVARAPKAAGSASCSNLIGFYLEHTATACKDPVLADRGAADALS